MACHCSWVRNELQGLNCKCASEQAALWGIGGDLSDELRREEESEPRWLEWCQHCVELWLPDIWTVLLCEEEVPKSKLSPLCLLGSQSVFLAAVNLEEDSCVLW